MNSQSFRFPLLPGSGLPRLRGNSSSSTTPHTAPMPGTAASSVLPIPSPSRGCSRSRLTSPPEKTVEHSTSAASSQRSVYAP